ncbi:hypothetical protein B9Z55_026645 [Caenorhabditis nigoni]|uniref:ceramide glucosyltransferase n=1 Tax=Caenorhabditis nigoni TaxID=1611254 RepID=A0A2G5T4B1_9PELO|nr:hypothetical protein B9Z55_026645 [Caenorhabditis nigoni]
MVRIISFRSKSTEKIFRTFHLHKVNEPDATLPGVSIIKPIMGTDENLEINLTSFFTAEYYQFELIFCFHSPEDVAVPVVKALIERYPDVDATICFQEHEIGFNPKINNMNPGYLVAKYPLIMISDSTIFMRPDGILDLAKRIMSHEKLGLITQIPYCMDRVGKANCFEQVFFGTSHSKIYLAGNFLGFNCPTGMSSIFKKAALEECGGMAAFKDYMAEDYFLGKNLAARGYKSGISNQPALQNSAATTFTSFANRVGGWAKLRIAMMPQVILVEPLQDCFPAGIIMAFSVYYLFDLNIPMTIFLNFLFWIFMDYMIMRVMQVNEPDATLPGVSIIKPIMGTDENLEINLTSFFTAEYYQFELIFCFHSPEDVAVPVVKALIERYPDVDATICFQEHEIGFNPKINNMNPGYLVAKYPLIMISDSTIFMRPDGILDLAKRIMSHEKLGLITQIPYCMDRVGKANCFEQVFFGTSHSKIYLAGNFLGFNCPTGMSSIFKKAALEECGGMAAFKDYMAEDYFLGKNLAARGYKSGISNQPALQNSAATTFTSFANRVGGWAKLRIAMMPQVILVEPLQDCFPAGIIMAFSVYYLFDLNIPMTIFLNFLFWIFMDYMIMRVMQNGPLTMSLIQFIGFWFLREF